jgi:hypothetical protein
MSSRAPVGASNRSNLFSSRKENEPNSSGGRTSATQRASSEIDDYEPAIQQRDREMEEAYGMEPIDQDPLQLEHMLGFAGEYRRTILAMPGDDNLYIKWYILLLFFLLRAIISYIL